MSWLVLNETARDEAILMLWPANPRPIQIQLDGHPIIFHKPGTSGPYPINIHSHKGQSSGWVGQMSHCSFESEPGQRPEQD